ncbi:hypothetical protein [Roseibium sp. M-1]
MNSSSACMVMFSGGRDSTLAALRLADLGSPLTLVTITSNHLVGIGHVIERLGELRGILPDETKWVRVQQPTALRTDTSFYEKTCLSCHHAYVVACGVLARKFNASSLAFGYATYQSDWPEQTPLAINSLRSILDLHGLHLELPVYDILSKDDAVQELVARGVSGRSLEQKCLRQVNNVRLPDDRLKQQIALWEKAIDQSFLRIGEIELEVLEDRILGSIPKGTLL